MPQLLNDYILCAIVFHYIIGSAFLVLSLLCTILAITCKGLSGLMMICIIATSELWYCIANYVPKLLSFPHFMNGLTTWENTAVLSLIVGCHCDMGRIWYVCDYV